MPVEIGTKQGTTYYSECMHMSSIVNPIINNNVNMRYSGFFEENSDEYDRNFDALGYGLKKTRTNKGLIYCSDASKVFAIDKGYVGMVLSLPENIYSGIYYPLRDSTSYLNEYLLWGVNISNTTDSFPTIYAKLTSEGIGFTIWTIYGKYTLINDISTIYANDFAFYEFIWDVFPIDDFSMNDFDATMVMRINGEDVIAANAPISPTILSGLNFCALDTPFNSYNMECTLGKLVLGNEIPIEITREWYSSSSSSSMEIIDSSSLSISSSSSSYEPIDTTSSSSSVTCVFETKGSIDDGGTAFAVWGDGTYIYLANYDDGLRAYTFNGSTFTNAGHIDDGGNYHSVWGDGTYIYLACGSNGLRAYTFNGSTFNLIDTIGSPLGTDVRGVWGDGNYIYVADYNNGFIAYDFDGASFTEAGRVFDGDHGYNVWGDGTYIYMANWTGGLSAYTFNGATFSFKGNITSGLSRNVWGDGTYVYGANIGYLKAYTFNGSNFFENGSINVTGSNTGVWGDGTYVYASWGYAGLIAYEFNGSNFISVANNGVHSYNVWGDGTYIYSAQLTSGLGAYKLVCN